MMPQMVLCMCIPGKSPCLPPGIQRRTWKSRSCRGRSCRNPCRTGWGCPGTAACHRQRLQCVKVGTVKILESADTSLSRSIKYVHLLLTGAHGVAPARDSAHSASRSTASGQIHRLHVVVEGGGRAQLDQHDVIADGPRVIVGVTDDAGGGDELLGTLVDSNVVLSKTHLNTASEETEERLGQSM